MSWSEQRLIAFARLALTFIIPIALALVPVRARAADLGSLTLTPAHEVVAWNGSNTSVNVMGYGSPLAQTCTASTCDVMKLDVEMPSGMRVGPISYPRALMRKLKFSKGTVAVYEGRTTLRFNVTVPPNYSGSSGEIKGKLRFQACNDESCFPPVTREVKMWLNVE